MTTKRKAPKRGNSLGSVRQLPSGKWQARLTVEDLGGNPQRVTLGTFKTKTEAEQAVNVGLTDAARGTFGKASKDTLEDFTWAWFEAKRPTMAPKYAVSLEGLMSVHIFPMLGKRKLSAITSRDLEAFYAALTSKRRYGKGKEAPTDTPLSGATKARIHSLLHQIFAEGVRHGELIKNPADVGRPTPIRKAAREQAPKAWTEEEATKFYQVARQDRRGVVLCFMLLTGLRIGEALGLRWENIEMGEDSARVHVVEGLVSLKGKAVRTTPKTARSRRSFSVSGEALAILKERPAQAKLDMEAQEGRYLLSDAVFTNSIGGEILPDTIYPLVKRLCKEAAVPYKGTHVLRHSFISIQGQHGKPLEVISAHVGHATASFTLDRYRTVFAKERESMTLQLPLLTEHSEKDE